MTKKGVELKVRKTKQNDTKLSTIIYCLQWIMKEYGDCNVYTDAYGALTSDFELLYMEDIFAYNSQRKEEMYHSGLFINGGFCDSEEEIKNDR